MKFTLPIIFASVIISSGIAQDKACSDIQKIEGSYRLKGSKEKYNGTCRENYEDGTKKREIQYKNGERISITSFDKSGNKSEFAEYNPSSVPNLTTWYPNGNLKQRVIYKEDKIETSSYYENGHIKTQLVSSGKYGLHDGTYKEWYSNGKDKLQEEYKEGKNHGERLTWYENGLPMSQETFDNGELVGEKENFKWTDVNKEYDLSEQKEQINTIAKCSNSSKVEIAITITYKLIEENLERIHFGSGKNYVNAYILPEIKETITEVISEYNSSEVVNSSSKEKIKQEILAQSKEVLKGKSIDLTLVQIDKILINQQ